MTSSTLHQDTMIRWRQRAPWFSVLWLFYLAYPIDQLFFSPQMTALQRWEGTMGSLVFIVVYLAFYFRNRLPSMRVILLTAALFSGLGVYLSWAVNENFYCFFIYAGVVLAALDDLRGFFGVVGADLAVEIATLIFRGITWQSTALIVMPTVLISFVMYGFYRFIAVTAQLGQAESEIRRLTEAETRMRITQDMHDVLGQSLASIVLRADLAARTPDTGRNEVQAIGELARQALAELRHVVQGTHHLSLADAISQAHLALEAAEVAAEMPDPLPVIEGASDTVLAYVLRESVTNVIRHSQAQRCLIQVIPSPGQILMSIEDDGVGPISPDSRGTGLRGIMHRVEAIGGYVEMGISEHFGGWRIQACIPEHVS